MCGNNSCLWVIILIILFSCCGCGGFGSTNDSGCSNGCNNGCGCNNSCC